MTANPDDCVSCILRDFVLMYWKKDTNSRELSDQLRNIHRVFKRRKLCSWLIIITMADKSRWLDYR